MLNVVTGFDDLDTETRRRFYGWFGEPWPSGVCYIDDDDTVVREHMRIPAPVGQPCFYCEEAFADGDQGKAMPYAERPGEPVVAVYTHKECLLREVVGPLKHVQGECTGVGQCHDDTGMTLRQEALAVWAWVQEHGI